jgi:UDP-N-acetylmuramoyl-L-alanyl-D-glutamate--2,6-diaminopimelate ligase
MTKSKPPPNLEDLFSGLEQILAVPPRDVVSKAAITGVTMDSRQVQPGYLFVAVSGGASDGHRYLADAVRRGAAALVGERLPLELPFTDLSVPYVRVADSRNALASLAAAFYGRPAHRMMMIGVTGTDGKTTTANLIFQILQAAGLRAGMISTVNAVIGDQVLDTGFHVTTPEAPSVQAYLAQMAASGLTHAVLETTSHGLAQQRVAACEFDIGVVTNITHEHLDYHGTFKAYRSAKGILFAGLYATPPKPIDSPRGAVLNRDDGSFEYLSGITRVPVLSYGLDATADIVAKDIESRSGGLRFTAVGSDLDGDRIRLPLETSLIGGFNVSNCLAALAVGSLLKLEPEAIRAGIAALHAVPGRMETIDLGQDFTAMVDFAHTPNALRRSLEAARRLTTGRVIAVFGSAGLRDKQKRRMMAQVSAELADLSVLTAEDPRTESLAAILAEMADGAQASGGLEGKTFWRVPDRRAALRFAVRLARLGDLVITCGKGHEQSMCFGEVEYLWDDRVALRAALAEHLGIPGPEMPYLPDM